MPTKISKGPKEKKKFEVPTIAEVQAYILKKKPAWGKAFSDWYGEKFWNSYEKSGWRLSAGRGGPVKNWEACFNSNWQTLKYPEDLAILEKLMPRAKPIDQDTLDYLNEALSLYRSDSTSGKESTSISEERLAACYDWMKENNLLRLTADQREEAIRASKIDLKKGKATAVRFAFDRMVKNLLDFNYYFNEVTEH